MIKELSEEQFKLTFGNEMRELLEEIENPVDIWQYVGSLVKEGIVEKTTFENELVENVYRNDMNTYDHVLLPTNKENVYLVVVIDLFQHNIFGHHKLDLNDKYNQ